MIKNKIFNIFLIFCFITFCTQNSFAQEKSDYEHINSGSCVSENGFFFTEQGMIKLATNVEQKIKSQNIDKQKEIELLKIDLQKCSASKESELRIQKELYENQLIIKQKTIDAYESQSSINTAKIFVGVIIGLSIGLVTMGVLQGTNGN